PGESCDLCHRDKLWPLAAAGWCSRATAGRCGSATTSGGRQQRHQLVVAERDRLTYGVEHHRLRVVLRIRFPVNPGRDALPVRAKLIHACETLSCRAMV